MSGLLPDPVERKPLGWLCGQHPRARHATSANVVAATLVGGPHDGAKITLTAATPPPRIQIGGTIYHRVDDPDTGNYLGAYAHQETTP